MRSLFLLLFLGARSACGISDLPDIKSVDDKMEQKRVNQEKSRKERGNVTKDIQRLGEETVNRIDRIIQTKAFELWGDPWTIQGIPIVFPGGRNGFNLGLRVALQDIERQDPHKFQLDAQVLASDKGRYFDEIGVDIPWAFDERFRIRARGSYFREISQRYYGLGNNTTFDPILLAQDGVLYSMVRGWPALNISVLYNVGRRIRLGPILGLKWTQIDAPPGSLLDRDQPLGILGGSTNYVGAGFEYNTLDFEPYPSRGYYHELYAALYGPFTASDYTFGKFTYTHKQYFLVQPRLILAYRVLLEAFVGAAPFYEFGSVGGSTPTIGFGGTGFLRGFDTNRFLGPVKAVLGVELRWDPLAAIISGQRFTFGLVPFFDVGRVWQTLLPLDFGGWHPSAGWGVRGSWNNRLIIRVDFAINSEQTALLAEVGNAF